MWYFNRIESGVGVLVTFSLSSQGEQEKEISALRHQLDNNPTIVQYSIEVKQLKVSTPSRSNNSRSVLHRGQTTQGQYSIEVKQLKVRRLWLLCVATL